MPYHIGNKGTSGCAGYPVIANESGKVVGCHVSKKKATKQLQALYANVPDVKEKEKTMANTFATSYAAITKSEKQEDGSLMVYGKATDDAIDSDNQICDMTWLAKAMPDWFKTGGNIREQHSNIAAGVAKELDSKDDGFYVTAHVVDAQSVKKVEAGVLKGFSIGIRAPRIVRDNKAANGRIVDGQIVEVSLVDRPANPNAKLMLAKSDGTEVIQVEEMIEQELPVAETAEVTDAPIIEGAVTETPIVETEEAEKSDSVNKCLECGCHIPDDSHGRADVTTAEIVSPVDTPKSSIVPLPTVERVGDIQDEDAYEDSEDKTSDKSATSDNDINAIIEKAVKSAIESVTSEVTALKSAKEAAESVVIKLEQELAKANQKAVSGGPKRAVINQQQANVSEFTRIANDYRRKAAGTEDKELALGYKELAEDFEAKAVEAQLTK